MITGSGEWHSVAQKEGDGRAREAPLQHGGQERAITRDAKRAFVSAGARDRLHLVIWTGGRPYATRWDGRSPRRLEVPSARRRAADDHARTGGRAGSRAQGRGAGAAQGLSPPAWVGLAAVRGRRRAVAHGALDADGLERTAGPVFRACHADQAAERER